MPVEYVKEAEMKSILYDGARSTCLLFSLIKCAIIKDINPEEYLSSVFELAADMTDWTDSKWSELSSLEYQID